MTNPDQIPLQLTVRVHDVEHDQRYEDRFNGAFEAPPTNRETIRIPMQDILAGPVGRPLDLAHVAGIVVFESSGATSVGRHFFLTRIWLE